MSRSGAGPNDDDADEATDEMTDGGAPLPFLTDEMGVSNDARSPSLAAPMPPMSPMSALPSSAPLVPFPAHSPIGSAYVNTPGPDRIGNVDRTGSDAALVPTGFPSLDRALGGGFRRGALVVLGGDDGAGCSALALGIALRTPPRAIVVTGEATRDRIEERALAMTARVPLESLRLAMLTPEGERRVTDARRAVDARAIDIRTMEHGGLDSITGAIDAVAHSATPSLVVVDSVESLAEREALMRVGRDEGFGECLLSLKRLALARNVAVLALTHLPRIDRTRQDKRPTLADFGGHGAVGMHADLVLGVFREELYDPMLSVTGAAELLILKHRDGARGYVDLYFSADALRFEDMLDVDDG